MFDIRTETLPKGKSHISSLSCYKKSHILSSFKKFPKYNILLVAYQAWKHVNFIEFMIVL